MTIPIPPGIMVSPQAGMTATERRERLDMMKKIHEIFVGLSGKNIQLVSGNPPGHTDTETFISIPIENAEEAGLVHKHEWQHIFMGSDLRARAAFVNSYITERGLVMSLQLSQFLHLLANAIDDLRVNHLWSKPYPKSSDDIANRWRTIILDSRTYQQDLIVYTMAVGLGLRSGGQLAPSAWDPYRPVIEYAVSKIWGNAFPTTLIATRLIVDAVFEKAQAGFTPVIKPPPIAPANPIVASAMKQAEQYAPPPPPPVQRRMTRATNEEQARQQAADKMVRGAEHSKSLTELNDTQVPQSPDPNPQRSISVADKAMNAKTEEEIQKVIHDHKSEVEQAITALMGQVRSLSRDEKLLHGIEDDVEFVDLTAQDVEALESRPEDALLIQTLKGTFARLSSLNKKFLNHTGGTVDVSAYVDMMLGNNNGEIFEDEEPYRGFYAMVLMDMSGSMRGYADILSRAARILSRAMKNPRVKFEVWGFSGGRDEAVIFRFKDPEKGFFTDHPMAWGSTPLHVATEVAIRHLQQQAGQKKHLFIISDGVPAYMGLKRHNKTENLMAKVARSVREAEQKKVHVLTLVLGAIPKQLCDLMFGKKKWISIDSQEELFEALLLLVQGAFVRYLRK